MKALKRYSPFSPFQDKFFSDLGTKLLKCPCFGASLCFSYFSFSGKRNLKKLFTGWMANQSVVSRLSASAGPLYLVARNNAEAILKRRGGHPTKNTAIDYQTADSEHVSKRPRPFGPSDEFIFSTATDGKIKAWLYDNAGSRVDYDAPGRSSATMAYRADGTRVFLCGTNKEGESHLVEWNESEGAVKRNYNGLAKRSEGDVKFDPTNNRFLTAGDEFKIKFWDMDNSDLLTTIDAEGGLPVKF